MGNVVPGQVEFGITPLLRLSRQAMILSYFAFTAVLSDWPWSDVKSPSTSLTSPPIVVDDSPEHEYGVLESNLILSPLFATVPSCPVHRLARKAAYCRLAWVRWSVAEGLTTAQNDVSLSESVVPVKLMKLDLPSTQVMIWPNCGKVYFRDVVAHCAPQ